MPVATAVVPDRGAIALALADGSVALYELKAEKLRPVYDPPSSTITAFAASENGRYIALGQADGTLIILVILDEEREAEEDYKGNLREFFSLPPSGEKREYSIDSLAFGPSSERPAVGGRGSSLVILERREDAWQSRTLLEPTNGGGTICALAFDAEGRTLVSGGTNGKVHVWDTEKWSHVSSFPPGSDPVLSLDVNAEGTHIAAITAITTEQPVEGCANGEPFGKADSGELKVTDRTGSQPDDLQWTKEASQNLGGNMFAEFTPSGNQLIAADSRGNIHAFDLHSGALLFTLQTEPYVARREVEQNYKIDGMDFGCARDGSCWLSIPGQIEVEDKQRKKWILFGLGPLATTSNN